MARRRIDAGERHGSGALNVVVETEHTVPIGVQQGVGIWRQEVFELDQRIGILLLNGSHELVEQGEIRAPRDPAPRISDVERVIEQLLVVRANVEQHR